MSEKISLQVILETPDYALCIEGLAARHRYLETEQVLSDATKAEMWAALAADYRVLFGEQSATAALCQEHADCYAKLAAR